MRKISILIPVKNGAATIEACLSGIFRQTLINRIEVILIDSGSLDNTLEIARKFDVRIHEIPAADFNHGTTRNLGVELAQGDYVIMTVQDAVPVDEFWVERMLEHFEDPDVVGVCGSQQVPHDRNKNPMQWHRSFSEPVSRKVGFDDPAEFKEMSGAEKRSFCGWDDVTAMYCKSALESVPFRSVMFAEDSLWAHDALSAGMAIVYEPNAAVHHYHHQPFSFRFRRMLTIFWHDMHFWMDIRRPRRFFYTMAQYHYHLMKNRKLTVREKLHWIAYNNSLLLSEWGAYLISFCSRFFGATVFNKVHLLFCKTSPVSSEILGRIK
jgi:rhamnosyltransferase